MLSLSSFFVFGWSCQYFFTDQIFHKKSYPFPCLKRFPKKMFTMTQTSPTFWSGTLSVITWWWYRCHSTKTQPNKENRDQIFRSKNLTPSLTCTLYNSILYNVQLSLWPKSWINCGAPLTCVASFIWDHRDFHFMSILYSRPPLRPLDTVLCSLHHLLSFQANRGPGVCLAMLCHLQIILQTKKMRKCTMYRN